ncbi:hypothetical protein ACS0TY_017463 [Phlomoides rotata]
MESHEYYSKLWKRVLIRAADLKTDILAPSPAKYITPKKMNDTIDYLQINNLLYLCAGIGEVSDVEDVKRLKKNLFDAFEIPEAERKMPDKKAFTYIKEQETKPELVVNLTEDEISTRRAWGFWVCLTEMDKLKYSCNIYQKSVNRSFLLNSMTGSTTRFANDMFEQKRAMIWENKLIGIENTR